MKGFFRLLIALNMALCCCRAESAETWLCTYKSENSAQFSSTLELAGNLLIEWPYDTRYRIIENNRYAIIAEDHYADFDPVLNQPNIFTTIVMLEKASLRYSQTVTLAGNAPRQWTGFCRERLETPDNAIASVTESR